MLIEKTQDGIGGVGIEAIYVLCSSVQVYYDNCRLICSNNGRNQFRVSSMHPVMHAET